MVLLIFEEKFVNRLILQDVKKQVTVTLWLNFFLTDCVILWHLAGNSVWQRLIFQWKILTNRLLRFRWRRLWVTLCEIEKKIGFNKNFFFSFVTQREPIMFTLEWEYSARSCRVSTGPSWTFSLVSSSISLFNMRLIKRMIRQAIQREPRIATQLAIKPERNSWQKCGSSLATLLEHFCCIPWAASLHSTVFKIFAFALCAPSNNGTLTRYSDKRLPGLTCKTRANLLPESLGKIWFRWTILKWLIGISCSDFKKIEAGLNESLGMLIDNMLAAIFNLIFGLIYGWKLSLVILAMSPLMILAAFFMTKVRMRQNQIKPKLIYWISFKIDLHLKRLNRIRKQVAQLRKQYPLFEPCLLSVDKVKRRADMKIY